MHTTVTDIFCSMQLVSQKSQHPGIVRTREVDIVEIIGTVPCSIKSVWRVGLVKHKNVGLSRTKVGIQSDDSQSILALDTIGTVMCLCLLHCSLR